MDSIHSRDVLIVDLQIFRRTRMRELCVDFSWKLQQQERQEHAIFPESAQRVRSASTKNNIPQESSIMFAATFALRIVFLGFVVYTLISANARPDLYGKPLCYNYVCINFDSWRQLSTFTRWSWCLIIAYFALIVFASTLRVGEAPDVRRLRGAPSRFPAPWSCSTSRGFFEFLYVNAAFIGVIVYFVLIPLVRWKGVAPRTDGTGPTAAQKILLESWQGHAMHLGASLLLEVERDNRGETCKSPTHPNPIRMRHDGHSYDAHPYVWGMMRTHFIFKDACKNTKFN